MAWEGISAQLVRNPPGMSYLPGGEMHSLGMHSGPPVKADCFCDGQRLRRVQRPGDIDIVPAGVDGSWKDDADSETLQISMSPSLLTQAAADLGREASAAELRPRLQLRDARIEAIGLAVRATLESPAPSDPLYIDLLAQALAVRLIETATDGRRQSASMDREGAKLSDRQLRALTEYIEMHLDQKLTLADLSRVGGVGLTRLKTLFRNSTGLPVHQYVIRRRVEYARSLIRTTDMELSEIAVVAGFSHQSHMASTMHRVIGQTPTSILREIRQRRPNLQTPA